MSLKRGISFPLLKFSIATDPPHVKIFNWNHHTQDVHVLFDSYGAVKTDLNSLPIVTVFQGQEVLERVNIALKAREAGNIEQQAQQTGTALSPSDLPTEVRYSRASRNVAIRYRTSDSQVRRLQLRFEADRDFDHALAIFQELGCKPLPGGSSQGRDTSTRPNSRGPSSHDFRPLTMGSVFLDSEEVPRLASSHFPATEEGLHSVAQSSQAKRPLTGSTWQRPTSALVPIREERAFHDDPVMQNIGGFDSRVPREPTRYQTATSGLTTTLTNSAHGSSRDHVFARPASMSKVPTISQLEHDLRSTIPPPRELPFKKPQSRDGVASRPASSIDLPSLPKPTYADASAAEIADGLTMKVPASRGRSTTVRSSTAVNATSKKPATATSAQNKVAEAKTASVKAAGARQVRSVTATRPLTPLTSDAGGGTAPVEDVRNALGQIDTAMSLSAPTTHSTEEDALAGYAAMTYEERMDVLERLIVGAVGDENFITLCEDVSGCWQRIGLGH